MTFLELASRLLTETGVDDNGVASVSGQTGMQLKAVYWINRAWTEIQNLQSWDFLWVGDARLTTVVGQPSYLPTEHLQLNPLLKKWITDSVRISDATGTGYLRYQPWARWQAARLHASSGKPTTFTINPQNALVFNALPDAAYETGFDYYRQPQVLSGNTDTPILPEHHHDIILYKAMEYLATEQGAPEIYQSGAITLRRMMSKLRHEHLPQISIGSSPVA